MAVCITQYVNFCVDNIAPKRTVRCFPNKERWITSDLKELLNRKKRTFGDRDMHKEDAEEPESE